MNQLSLPPLQFPVPRHIAIIMDGNGRWAEARGQKRTAGHRAGADAVREAVRSCGELGVNYLTLYAFSNENWKRPMEEVDDLMGLLRFYLKRELAELHKNNVKLQIIGRRDRLSVDIVALIDEAENKTRYNYGLHLVIAIDYGGQQEIIQAIQSITKECLDGTLRHEDITLDLFPNYLLTRDIPNPDLIVRTSGEKRLSNFLLWQSAYAELVFVDCLWPDFDKNMLVQVISEFQNRERRFGDVRSPA